MHFQTTSIMAVLVGLIASTNATILLGNTVNDNRMWIEGDSACDAKFVSTREENPCGRRVTLRNGYTYFLGNCGSGDIILYNGDGSFNSQCKYGTKNTDCGVVRTWRC